MKKTFVIPLLLMSGTILGQGVEAELYQYNYSFIHPAFAGIEGERVSMLGRTTTYDGSFSDQKETMVLMSYENFFEKINSGIQVTGYSERLGPSSLSSLSFSYNYKLNVGESADLITSARAARHFLSVSTDYYRTIDPTDPVLNPDLSASNFAVDFGLLLKVKKSHFGLVANNLLHTDNRMDMIQSTSPLEGNFAAIAGTSFTISEHVMSRHSLYVPFDVDEYRVDLNNTISINDLFLAGVSIERSDDKFFLRGNAGVKVKDYFQIVFLLYSNKRKEFTSEKFRGEIFMGFTF